MLYLFHVQICKSRKETLLCSLTEAVCVCMVQLQPTSTGDVGGKTLLTPGDFEKQTAASSAAKVSTSMMTLRDR